MIFLLKQNINSIIMIVLVTGGLGFIGSELVRQLQSFDAEIRIIDDGHYGACKKLLDEWGCKYTLFQGSITDREYVRHILYGVNYVFHLGALISVAESFSVPALYEYINVHGTIVLLQEAVKAGVTNFVFSSSSANYGDASPPRKIETHELHPVSPYALTKVHGEDYCKFFNNTTAMKVVSLRYFNVFGLNQDASRPYAACIANFFKQTLDNDDITIYGTGEQTRSFVHVEDVALANIHAALEGLQGIYNVGYDQEVSINTVACKIVALTNDVSIKYEAARDGDVQRMSCNPSKLLSTGFMFKYTLESGLEYMATSYKQKGLLK